MASGKHHYIAVHYRPGYKDNFHNDPIPSLIERYIDYSTSNLVKKLNLQGGWSGSWMIFLALHRESLLATNARSTHFELTLCFSGGGRNLGATTYSLVQYSINSYQLDKAKNPSSRKRKRHVSQPVRSGVPGRDDAIGILRKNRQTDEARARLTGPLKARKTNTCHQQKRGLQYPTARIPPSDKCTVRWWWARNPRARLCYTIRNHTIIEYCG